MLDFIVGYGAGIATILFLFYWVFNDQRPSDFKGYEGEK